MKSEEIVEERSAGRDVLIEDEGICGGGDGDLEKAGGSRSEAGEKVI